MHPKQYQHIDPLVLLDAVAQDQDAFRALSGTFLEIAPPMLKRLDQAVHAGDNNAIFHETHALKGTTSLVGAMQLTSLIQEMEKSARLGEGSLARYMPELTRLFHLVSEEVKASASSSEVPGTRQ